MWWKQRGERRRGDASCARMISGRRLFESADALVELSVGITDERLRVTGAAIDPLFEPLDVAIELLIDELDRLDQELEPFRDVLADDVHVQARFEMGGGIFSPHCGEAAVNVIAERLDMVPQ